MTARELSQAIPDFYLQQAGRCVDLGVDVHAFPVSHVAVRTPTWNEYLKLRDSFEQISTANLENVWNGRPISKLKLAEPLTVPNGKKVTLIELIPPPHQQGYRMGLEHVGYVVGDDVDTWAERNSEALTGRQYQSPVCMPFYIQFDDQSHVKFYRHPLAEVCAKEGRPISGFVHADQGRPDLR